MITDAQHTELLAQIQADLNRETDREAALLGAMRTIAQNLPHYNWVGIYMHDNGVLNLGPYVGAETEHTIIRVGVGVCGTAVAENKNQIVDDVRALSNYLSCSVETRSEIVVLIHDAPTGQILGQIDADGHTVGAFDETDERFLQAVAERLAPRLLQAPGDAGA